MHACGATEVERNVELDRKFLLPTAGTHPGECCGAMGYWVAPKRLVTNV
jgi:hypothetical protein